MRASGIFLLSGILLLATGCVEIPEYDAAPSIEFTGIEAFEVDDTFPTDGSPASRKTVVSR